MLTLNFTPPARYVLSRYEIERIFRIAPLFDVFAEPCQDGQILIRVQDGKTWRSVRVSPEIANVRVLTEVCEKTVRWVHFHEGEHCARSLLALTDARLERLSHLYQEKNKLFPSSAEDVVSHSSSCPLLKKAGTLLSRLCNQGSPAGFKLVHDFPWSSMPMRS